MTLVSRRRVLAMSFVLSLLLCAVAIVLWISYALRQDPVSRRIAESVASNDSRPIDFAQITDFDWDRVYCFDCYTGQREIEKRLGFPWPGLGGSAIESSDGVTLIVFVKNGRVVRSFDQSRREGDFGKIDNPHGLTRAEARFVLNRASSHPWMSLAGVVAVSPATSPTTSPGH